jgi:hypothetical protein
MGLGLLAIHLGAQADATAVVGVLQGSAVLVRQSTRFTLAEGVRLADGDIIETGDATYVQIEFGDATITGLGEGTRVILRPTLYGAKSKAVPGLYMLEGWVKLRYPPARDAAFVLHTPAFELEGKAGSAVVHLGKSTWEAFAETGAVRLSSRGGSFGSIDLAKGEAATLRESQDKPQVGPQLPAEFIQAMPRSFREKIPARAALYESRSIQPQALGPVTYDEVSPWLHAESAIRLPLSRQWRGRAADKAFRASVAANLGAHREWERVLYPERFLPKKPALPAAAPLVPVAPVAAASEPTQ